jgi:hypothetical protein
MDTMVYASGRSLKMVQLVPYRLAAPHQLAHEINRELMLRP